MNEHPLSFRISVLGFARATALTLVLHAVPDLHAATRTWDNDAGTNVWGTAANWSGDAVPATSDTVIINNGDTVYTGNLNMPGSLQITLSGNSILSANVNASTGATLRMNGTNLTVESGSRLSGNWWDLGANSQLTFYDGSIANMSHWEFRGNNTIYIKQLDTINLADSNS